MQEIIPLFKSHYSLGRSILTLQKPEDMIENGSDSILKICEDHDIKNLFLVDDSMSGFLEAYINSKELGISLAFGLRITVCDDKSVKNKDSLQRQCKYVVFAKNSNGYNRLIKISSDASQNGFYYEPRTDFASLKKVWSEKDLLLAVPFYDSFIFKNCLEGSVCVPDFSFAKPTFFLEENSTFIDEIISRNLLKFCGNKYETVRAQSIYYKHREDFKAYLTFRCINKRSTLERPEFSHMSTNDFCFEKWASLSEVKLKETKINIEKKASKKKTLINVPKSTVVVDIPNNIISKIIDNAQKAEIGGKSQIFSNREERSKNLKLNQITGQFGEAAGCAWFFRKGGYDKYLEVRNEKNKNKFSGDNGCDIPNLPIDIKGTRVGLKMEQGISRVDLDSPDFVMAVRPRERHKGHIYVQATVGYNADSIEDCAVYLTGWAKESDLPKEPAQSGLYEGAYCLPFTSLRPMPRRNLTEDNKLKKLGIENAINS